jgi:hypothetical protein
MVIVHVIFIAPNCHRRYIKVFETTESRIALRRRSKVNWHQLSPHALLCSTALSISRPAIEHANKPETMEANRRQTLEERRQVIASVLVQAYFGHAHIQMSIWSDLQRYCESYFAVAENKRAKESACPAQLLQRMLVEIIDKHSLNTFPVSPKHKKRVLHWLAKLFHSHSVPLCEPLDQALAQDAEKEPEPEFIFKTFTDSNGLPLITLLEENRNLIGHGTTGLTTWQGAMFLADWAQNFEHLIKVFN